MLYGALGDDLIELADGAFRKIDGGTGTDTVALGGDGVTLDLTTRAESTLVDIEVIDLSGTGDNTLVLEMRDLVHASATSNVLVVEGNEGDAIEADLSTGTFSASAIVEGYTDFTDGTLTLRVCNAVDQNGI